MSREFEQIFSEIRRIWEEDRDGSQIAEFYHLPFLALRGGGEFVCIETRAEAGQFFQTAIDGLYERGFVRWEYRELTATPIGKRGVMVTLTWMTSRRNQVASMTIKQSYTLVSFNGVWKIVLSIIHLEDSA
jgi:hypothetical protein